MRAFLLTLLGTTALVACSGDKTPAETGKTETSKEVSYTKAEIEAESARLNEWFEDRWLEQLEFSPITKASLGIKDEDYGKIDDVSEAAEDEQLEWRRQTVADLKANFDYNKLSPEAQTSYDIWIYELKRAEDALPFRRMGYVFSQMQGPQSSLPNVIINFHSVETEQDMADYVSRLSELGRALNQLIDRAELSAAEGIHPPSWAYEAVIEQSKALSSGAPFEGEGETPLYAAANQKLAGLLEAGVIDEAEAEEFRAAARTALLEDVKPAYDRLIAFAEGDLENSPEVATGFWQFENGREFYAERLAFATTTDLTADEVHEIGLSEVARIRAEMEAIKEQVGFEGTLQEFFAFVRDDEQFYFPNTDEGRQAYIDAADEHLAFINDKLPEYFGLLPKADLVVKRVEAFREQDGAAQHYYPGTPDGSRPGVYYAHLSDMSSMPIPQLEVIAYHEGNPGHHMQISIAQELTSVPTFRTQSFFNAYAEGWALYSELLAKEMGAYEDPYSDFGRLTTEIWRAIRLVVDTGVHHKEWTEEEAIAYFRDNSPAATQQIVSEVRRYIVWPGQATSYKIGMLKILEIRAKAEAELGDDFDIKGFHDTVLGGGGLPMNLLEKRVDQWIESQKG
ncbi:DUF885 domain-containing protein [Parvularcula marina]|uniref:DUF885 domain-containing protein n=1 Tax=Parvularcula marina TaxID=2292771 RepID=A0A371RH95_9PROT|nr:DUF885 domain-containing protein [Parvularcula marina]RFB04823.1 DUF885 domain-containing protein [Parvularcula marina]